LGKQLRCQSDIVAAAPNHAANIKETSVLARKILAVAQVRQRCRTSPFLVAQAQVLTTPAV
jgi:hypothetical protein